MAWSVRTKTTWAILALAAIIAIGIEMLPSERVAQTIVVRNETGGPVEYQVYVDGTTQQDSVCGGKMAGQSPLPISCGRGRTPAGVSHAYTVIADLDDGRIVRGTFDSSSARIELRILRDRVDLVENPHY